MQVIGCNDESVDQGERLSNLRSQAVDCLRCDLSATRNNVVFGTGPSAADVMFIGEAPGREEDLTAEPFIGRSGALLTQLLADAGVTRSDVYIANVVCCRPPENRDPRPDEIAACSPWLEAQIAAVEPVVICTLGNFATRLLRRDRAGITSVHGKAEAVVVGGLAVWLYPLFHPAAALRATSTRALLAADIQAIPALASRGRPQLLG